MKQDKANVIIPVVLKDILKDHEIEAAWIVAQHFNTTVEFLIPIDGYKIKTADLVIEGRIWELKSPSGKSKTTVGNQFKRATKQSKYIIFDGRRINISDNEVQRKIKYELSKRRTIRRLLYINAQGTMMEISR
jgi:curli biogenesis system outer membrane secretion channel CsgG